MEFYTRTLVDSLRNHQRKGYDLFCVLLATDADSNVFPELLSRFHELHHLTGPAVVLFAPEVGLGHGQATPDDYFDCFDGATRQLLNDDFSRQIRAFLRRQTAETYTFLRNINKPPDTAPGVIFFDNPKLRGECVIWNIKNLSASQIVHGWRDILSELHRQGCLGLRHQLFDLQSKLSAGGTISQRIAKLREYIDKLDEMSNFVRIYNQTMQELVNSYDEIVNDESIFIHRRGIGSSIRQLQPWPQSNLSTILAHLRIHRRRWHGRMPTRYLAAIDRYFKAANAVAQSEVILSRSPEFSNLSLDELRSRMLAELLAEEESWAARERQLKIDIASIQERIRDTTILRILAKYISDNSANLIKQPHETNQPIPQNVTTTRRELPMEITPHIDIGILTIKEEEFEAVLDAFPKEHSIYTSAVTKRQYILRTAIAGGEATYRVAIVRQPEQGNGEAQSAARDLIEDLHPRLILVVGIAGGLPSKDVTLGDVILSIRIHDYTIEARKDSGSPTYAMMGGPVGRDIENHVAILRGRLIELGDWTAGLPMQPPVIVEDKNLYGPDNWQSEVREALQHHFAVTSRSPVFRAGVIASSDRLIKDSSVLIPWLQTARNLLAVEMESGGVYRAARERCSMLAIRGISDIVGFQRDERWTRYACASAAAFARAYLQTAPVEATSRNPSHVR